MRTFLIKLFRKLQLFHILTLVSALNRTCTKFNSHRVFYLLHKTSLTPFANGGESFSLLFIYFVFAFIFFFFSSFSMKTNFCFWLRRDFFQRFFFSVRRLFLLVVLVVFMFITWSLFKHLQNIQSKMEFRQEEFMWQCAAIISHSLKIFHFFFLFCDDLCACFTIYFHFILFLLFFSFSNKMS